MKLEGDPNGANGQTTKTTRKQGAKLNFGARFFVKRLTQKWCFWWLKTGEVDIWMDFLEDFWNQFQLSQVELLEICFFYTSDARHDPKNYISLIQPEKILPSRELTYPPKMAF